MKAVSNNSSVHPMKTSAWCFSVLLFMLLGLAVTSGCGPSDPPEIDDSVANEIAAEDEAVADAESEL